MYIVLCTYISTYCLYINIRIFIYVEVNECEEGISGCQQLCNNSNGSYHCDCYSGYHLKEDRHMCEGE